MEKANGRDIYRMKALISIDGNDNKMLFQGVSTLFDNHEGELWEQGETRICRLVFIGKSLNAEELRAGLKGCLVATPAPAE